VLDDEEGEGQLVIDKKAASGVKQKQKAQEFAHELQMQENIFDLDAILGNTGPTQPLPDNTV